MLARAAGREQVPEERGPWTQLLRGHPHLATRTAHRPDRSEPTRGVLIRAAVVPRLGAPLELRDIPVPEPGPGQVLVRIQASGLCHTDIHAARGDWPVKPRIPLIPDLQVWWS